LLHQKPPGQHLPCHRPLLQQLWQLHLKLELRLLLLGLHFLLLRGRLLQLQDPL
jgi:hypothetical protein